ncbi:hypothetical protein INT47_005138, partial [Mucor saturninus]
EEEEEYKKTKSSIKQMTNAPNPPPTATMAHQANDGEAHCEKYRQFMDSSVQERTFMIEKLVETFANVIDSIWNPKLNDPKVKVMPTRLFCNQILKRSKATYSTLQISLFYIFRVKKIVHDKLRLKGNMQTSQQDDLMCCGRRMFLASLMVASKYLHDKNYHNKAWAKITGLDIKEINAAEMAFLTLIDYRLFVSKPTFDRWYTQIHSHIQKSYIHQQPNPTAVQQGQQITIKQTPLSSQQVQQQTLLHLTDYPSPPPDPLAPSPVNTKCYQSNSFGMLSPPLQPIGSKRPSEMDHDQSTNKRTC